MASIPLEPTYESTHVDKIDGLDTHIFLLLGRNSPLEVSMGYFQQKFELKYSNIDCSIPYSMLRKSRHGVGFITLFGQISKLRYGERRKENKIDKREFIAAFRDYLNLAANMIFALYFLSYPPFYLDL